MSTFSKVKDLLQVIELQFANSPSKDTTVLVLCDTPCSYSWMSNGLAIILFLQGTALKMSQGYKYRGGY